MVPRMHCSQWSSREQHLKLCTVSHGVVVFLRMKGAATYGGSEDQDRSDDSSEAGHSVYH